MNHLKPIILGLATTPLIWAVVLAPFLGWWAICVFLVIPAITIIAVDHATWDKEPSADSNGERPDVIRGDLPSWAWFLATPDERLPGGTYEPTVDEYLEEHGPFACSVYWLYRNQLHGLSFAFAQRLPAPWPIFPGYYEVPELGLWWLRYPLLGNTFQLKAGYRQYYVGGQLYGVPCCTITRA
jgi:hypothetical protein